MSIQSTVDIDYIGTLSPRNVLKYLLDTGWHHIMENKVMYLNPGDQGAYDWQLVSADEFDINDFVSQHSEECPVGISLVRDHDIGGDFLIRPKDLTISVVINRQYLPNSRLVDFSWYLNKLHPFMERIGVHSFKCEQIS